MILVPRASSCQVRAIYNNSPARLSKTWPARGTLFLSRPKTVGAYAQKSIILDFTHFILPFFALGLGILTLSDHLGIYTHESPFALWYTVIYFPFCEGFSFLSIRKWVEISDHEFVLILKA
jgi:hypothetical protein